MNLSDMTVTQLREIAADLNIPGRSKMKKADLISAIEFAQMRRAETPASDFDHAAAVAQIRANIDAEDEARAAARRARNRTNYVPATEAAEQADAEAGELLDAVLGEYTGPRTGEVAILRDAPGRAIVTAAFDGFTYGGSIVRKGKRLVLTAGAVTVTGNTFEKVAKLFAAKLGFRAEIIDVARSF